LDPRCDLITESGGTDSLVHKSGDYFGVAASRAAEVSEAAI
jgi:hypothetical protein